VSAGLHIVTVQDLNGCSDATIEVFVVDYPKFFTPNGDGINDDWGVPGIRFYSGARVQVYDRGGLRMFYTEDAKIRWDGTHKGKDMPVGSYYWIIEVDETGEQRKGIVNLLIN
jgi:gliding motility-associated-like protein